VGDEARAVAKQATTWGAAMTGEDLELLDALVWAGCISRSIARDVAKNAPDGRVATYITERGYAPAIAPPQVILSLLAKYEAIEEEAKRFVDDLAKTPVRIIGDLPETD